MQWRLGLAKVMTLARAVMLSASHRGPAVQNAPCRYGLVVTRQAGPKLVVNSVPNIEGSIYLPKPNISHFSAT